MTKTAQINMEELFFSFPGEQKTCGEYEMENIGVDFTYRELPKGSCLGMKCTPAHQLLFILEGSCTLQYDEFPKRRIHQGEMILVRRQACYSGYAEEDLKLLVMSFDSIFCVHDKQTQKIYDACRAKIKYDFRPTKIQPPLSKFCSFLVYLIHSNANCAYLYELKHQELFFCLKWFYTKEEVAYLLYEITGSSFDFRQAVYENCDKASTVNDLIRLMNMSRAPFFRRFRQEFGITAYRWMLKHRREQIIRSIVGSDIGLNTLYEQFGYASRASFYNFCKREFGYTPQQLIEQYRQL